MRRRKATGKDDNCGLTEGPRRKWNEEADSLCQENIWNERMAKGFSQCNYDSTKEKTASQGM